MNLVVSPTYDAMTVIKWQHPMELMKLMEKSTKQHMMLLSSSYHHKYNNRKKCGTHDDVKGKIMQHIQEHARKFSNPSHQPHKLKEKLVNFFGEQIKCWQPN